MRAGSISYAFLNGVYVLNFSGEIRVPLCSKLSEFGDTILSDGRLQGLTVDLTAVRSIDSTALGLLVKLALGMEELGLGRPLIVSTDPNVNRTLEMTGFHQIFHILKRMPSSLKEANKLMVDVAGTEESEIDLCEQVLEAHRLLMNMNKRNEKVFKPVVQALEEEQLQLKKPQ